MVLMFQCFSMFQKQCNMDKSIIYQSKKRSCLKFQIKKTLALKHGQINATISQVSMFHMFLYIISISLKHLQKVFGTRLRGRKIMLIGRQGSTRSGSCSIQFFSRFLVGYLWRWRPGRPAISALCRDLIKKNPYAFRISQDYTTRVKI